ncbi:MAG: TetR family transcriptional regulator, partial [Solirubrobacterales bacterium]|nr:TetR family transcriptional regulator [Solirubrobacterales bacterium]
MDVARELLDEGERVDVQGVARRLGVSRATLHRWFGTREALLGALFERMAIEFRRAAEAGARGRGDARAFDYVRRMAESSAAYGPLRAAATREPDVVLRLVLAEGGPVHRQFADGFRTLLAASREPRELRRLAQAIDT